MTFEVVVTSEVADAVTAVTSGVDEEEATTVEAVEAVAVLMAAFHTAVNKAASQRPKSSSELFRRIALTSHLT